MAATPVYALPYPVPTDPADVPADVKRLADRLEVVIPTIAPAVPLSSTPPASPVDGQLWAWPHPVAGVWMFRYVAAIGDAQKWCFIGGPPLTAYGAAGTTGIIGGVFALLPADIAVNVPRTGQYVVHYGATVFPGASACTHWLGLVRGATQPVADGAASVGGYSSVASARVPLSGFIASGLNASDALQLAYNQNSGANQNMTANNRFISLLPVRVQ